MTADQIRLLQPALATPLVVFRPGFKRAALFEHWERYVVGLITELNRPKWPRAAITIRNATKRHTEADAGEEDAQGESGAAILNLNVR